MQPKITDNLQSFAARVRSSIKRRGLTLAKVADALDVSVSTVGAWTQAKNFPEVDLQLQLAKLLGEPVEWLIHGVAHPAKVEITDGIEIPPDPQKNKSYQQSLANPTPFGPNSSFTPPRISLSEPTEADVRRYVEEYLAEARHVPGAVGRVWVELQLRLPLDEIRKLHRQLTKHG